MVTRSERRKAMGERRMGIAYLRSRGIPSGERSAERNLRVAGDPREGGEGSDSGRGEGGHEQAVGEVEGAVDDRECRRHGEASAVDLGGAAELDGGGGGECD